jgi:RNA polymerase-binding transcription factor DksA
MSEVSTYLTEVPIGGKAGFVWNRLHGEREQICDALLNDSELVGEEDGKDLLQKRLRKVDDALDRLMSGSYGHCSKCGRTIDESRLEVDPVLGLCLDCWGAEHPDNGVNETRSSCDLPLRTLNAFDTIVLRTHNSDYRIMLLDPETGRALVEGGTYLIEPAEALLRGSAVRGAAFRSGEICVGCRVEMWVDEKVFITSPVKSIEIHHPAETVVDISEALN